MSGIKSCGGKCCSQKQKREFSNKQTIYSLFLHNMQPLQREMVKKIKKKVKKIRQKTRAYKAKKHTYIQTTGIYKPLITLHHVSLQNTANCLYTVSQKSVPHLACYNFDASEQTLIFFGRHITDKVSSQKTLFYAASNNVCFCITWQTGKHKNLHFHSCISALPEFDQPLLDFFNLFNSRLILTLLYDSINLVISAFSSGLLGAWFRRKEVESTAAVGLCCTQRAPVRCLLGFLFCKVMLKHQVGEVGKQSIV